MAHHFQQELAFLGVESFDDVAEVRRVERLDQGGEIVGFVGVEGGAETLNPERIEVPLGVADEWWITIAARGSARALAARRGWLLRSRCW